MMTPADIVAAITWVFYTVSPIGLTVHRGYVDGVSPRECASVPTAFNPNITNVRIAYDRDTGRCYVEVKQMTQTDEAMTYLDNDSDQAYKD